VVGFTASALSTDIEDVDFWAAVADAARGAGAVDAAAQARARAAGP
jgi:hypothetical protein